MCHRQREKGDLNWIRFKCHAVKQNVTQIEFQPKQNLLLFYLFLLFSLSNKERRTVAVVSTGSSVNALPLCHWTLLNQTCENDTQIVSSSCLNWIIWHQQPTMNDQRVRREKSSSDACTTFAKIRHHEICCTCTKSIVYTYQGQQQESDVFKMLKFQNLFGHFARHLHCQTDHRERDREGETDFFSIKRD